MVNVAPTIVDLLNIPAPKQWQGHSLWPLLDGKADDSARGEAYSETYYPRFHYGWSSLQSFTNRRLKYIFAPRDELFDLSRDAQELRELAGDRRRHDLKKRMLAFVSRNSRGALKSASIQRMSADNQRRLASLGYLSGTVNVDESLPLADPKDKIAASRSLAQTTQMVEENRLEEAATLLDRLTREEPALADAWNLSGSVNLKQRKHPEAVAIDPAASRSFNLAGEALIMKNDYAAAEAMLRQGIQENAQAKNTHYILARMMETLNRPETAIDMYMWELEINAEKYQAAVNLAHLLKQRRRFAEAAHYYRMAIHANAALKTPRFNLAEIMLWERRNFDQAIALCLEGIDLPPRDHDTLFGYFVLTKLFNAIGNAERRDYYLRLGEALNAALGR